MQWYRRACAQVIRNGLCRDIKCGVLHQAKNTHFVSLHVIRNQRFLIYTSTAEAFTSTAPDRRTTRRYEVVGGADVRFSFSQAAILLNNERRYYDEAGNPGANYLPVSYGRYVAHEETSGDEKKQQ